MPKMKILKAFEEPFRFTGRYLFLVGGRGSGKTHFAVQKTIVRCLTETNSNHLVVRKTNPALRKSIWKSFFRYLHNNPEIEYEPRYTDQTIIINRNEIVFSGLDDPDKVKSIDGINAGVVMEECSDFTRDDFDALDAILRGKVKTYSQIIGMLNPDRKTTFVYKDFVETEKPDSLVHVSNVYDNLYMPESYRKVLENINDPEKRKSWLLGEWADTGDLIFTHYRIVNHIDVEVGKFTFVAGVDWGFTDPSVFLLIGIYDSGVYVMDELYERQMQTTEFCNRINELLAEYGIGNFDVFPDCAEPDRNEILSNVTNLNVVDIKKDKLGEIAIVKEHNLFISSQCVETVKEIQSYSWKKDRDGNTIDKPADGGDHCLAGNTLVDTIDGQFEISELVGESGLLYSVKDGIISINKFSNVRKTGENVDTIKLITVDGRSFVCTPDHAILTIDGWVEAGNIKETDKIVDIMDAMRYTNEKLWSMKWEELLSMMEEDLNEMIEAVIICKQAGILEKDYIDTFMKNIMGKYLMECKSIISTATRIITRSKILKRSHYQSTVKFIGKWIEIIKYELGVSISGKLLNRAENGINHRMEENGIVIMQKSNGEILSELNMNVFNAARSLYQKNVVEFISALRYADQNIDVIQELITKDGYAKFVAARLRLTNILKLRTVAKSVQIQKIERSHNQDVYNLDVEGTHCFSINGGLIVHNCMDALEYAVAGYFRNGQQFIVM